MTSGVSTRLAHAGPAETTMLDFEARVDRIIHDPAVYRRSAELVESGGIARGNFSGRAERGSVMEIDDPRATHFCVQGALVRAALELGHIESGEVRGIYALQDVAFRVMADAHSDKYHHLKGAATYLRPHAPTSELSLVEWNNTDATKEDVVEMFRRTALSLDAIARNRITLKEHDLEVV